MLDGQMRKTLWNIQDRQKDNIPKKTGGTFITKENRKKGEKYSFKWWLDRAIDNTETVLRPFLSNRQGTENLFLKIFYGGKGRKGKGRRELVLGSQLKSLGVPFPKEELAFMQRDGREKQRLGLRGRRQGRAGPGQSPRNKDWVCTLRRLRL